MGETAGCGLLILVLLFAGCIIAWSLFGALVGGACVVAGVILMMLVCGVWASLDN